jgi:RND family efflux transporter MFP subunit
MERIIRRFAGTFILAVLLPPACHKNTATAPPSDTAPPVAVQLAPATLESHQATEDVVGTVRSKQRAVIEAKVSGRLVQYLAAPGQLVKSGELLAELDVQEIRARREQAKALLDQAQRDLARQEQLITNKATSQQELDAASARAKVAVAGLSEAETMLGYARVTAPFDGVVTRKLADVGDLAMPGKPLLEIEAPTVLRFETDLPESLLNRIKLGATLAITIPSLPKPLTASVAEISPVADALSRTFLVKLDLPDAAGLRPGQFGRVAVPVAESQLLLVPRQAVLRRGQIEAVFVVRDGRAALRLVKTGKLLGEKLEVLSGLEPGDPVVTGDAALLTDGQSVTPAQP